LITKEELLGLEKQVWNALQSGDRTADSKLLADNFLGVYSSGFDGKDGHCEQLASGPTVTAYELSNVLMKILSPHMALLSYRADFSRPSSQNACVKQIMFVSSIWQNFNGRWLNIFSQDTAADESYF